MGSPLSLSALEPPGLLLPPSLTNGAPPPPGVQNTLSAVNEVQQIPQQLKAQAHNWAKGELAHLLNVLQVMLEDDPQSVQGLADVAQNISSDAKDIASGDGDDNNANGSAGISLQSESISIKYEDTLSVSVEQVASDGQSATKTVINQSESLEIDIEQQDITASTNLSSDANLLQEAFAAIGQALKALENQNHSGANGPESILAGADNGLRNTLLNLVNGLVPGFLESSGLNLVA